MKRSKATKRSRKAAKKRTKPDDKEAATSISAAVPHVEEAAVVEAPEPEAITETIAQPEDKPAVLSSRSEAARRTAEGKFTKAVFAQIGGTECPRFAPMTWKERDVFMAKPENSVVRERCEAHLASVKSETKA
jgi:hypothetical protein